MNKKRIEVGDTVNVFFGHSSMVSGEVDYIPCSAGEEWIILEDQDERPVYVQVFDYMILIRKAEQI